MSASYTGQYATQLKRREAMRARAARPRAQPQLTLAAVLGQAPQIFDGKRITAVDRNIVAIGTLPERVASQVKTLYLSKNMLASLEGVEQFRELKALSAADNALGDLATLGALREAGIQLEAANFEGNPIADLPNYCAHVLVALGPSLQMLDNRPVTPEEREAAGPAVAHEATMLALMLSNACLVHKLGRAVQLVRLHCELRCAVLGGQYGSGAGLHEGDMAGNSSRFLELWDYEGTLNRQERHVILLAIRREVARRYKRMLLAGAKLDGGSKAWQQAFAQVMLAQQETVAALVQMLEEARLEAASVLRPLVRPASPQKLRALQSEQEANGRVKQDREALITELRDSYLGLADGASASTPRRHHYEQRIRSLQAALQASAAAGPGALVAGKEQPEDASTAAPAAGGSSEWSIPAGRARGPAAARPSPAASPTRSALARPKSALRQPGSRGPAGAPRQGSGGSGSSQPAGLGQPRPASAPVARPAQARPSAIPAPSVPGHSACSTPRSPAGQLALAAKADCWAEAAPDPEQHRAEAPLPFGGLSSSSSLQDGQHGCGAAAAAGGVPVRPCTAPSHALRAAELAAAPTHPSQPTSPLGRGPSSASLSRSPPGTRLSSRPTSPSTWRTNPLSGHAPQPPLRRPTSPAMQHLVGMLSKEGEQKQIEVLQATVAELEAANSQLEGANCELADSLHSLHEHAWGLEAQLAAQQQELGQRAAAAVVEAEGAAQKSQEVEAANVLLRLEVESQPAQLAAQQRDIEAREAELGALRCKVTELEARDPIRLVLTVSFEAELLAERVRSAALEARAAELGAKLAAHQRQEQLRLASELLSGRSCLRRVFARWRFATGEQAHYHSLGGLAVLASRTQLLRKWLGRWRLALKRSRVLAVRASLRQTALQRAAWAAWRQHCHQAQLRRALEVAAELHRQTAVLRLIVRSWQAATAARRQLDLPLEHPTMVRAAQLRRARALAVAFQAWRGWLVSHVKPKLAQLSQSAAHYFMGAQRHAWAAWREYIAHRRHRAMLRAVAAQHFLSKHLQLWREGAAECKAGRAEALRGAISNKVLLLRRAWRAWWQAVQAQYAERAAGAAAVQHRKQVVLCAAWACWQEWTQLAGEVVQRQRARVLQGALHDWRLAVRAAEKRRTAVRFHERRLGLRGRLAFRAWRHHVEAKRLRLQRVVHAQEVLLRWRMARALALWRRCVLLSKLQHSLGQVQQLQAAIGAVRQELERKAAEVESLESVKLTVETHAQSLSLRVTSLDSELVAAEAQVAELRAALEAAQAASAAAATARDEAATVSERACQERDAAAAARVEALAEAVEACEERDLATLAAQEAAEQREAATAARAAAEAAAAAAAAEAEGLRAKLDSIEGEAGRLREERQSLVGDLDQALQQLQAATAALSRAQQAEAELKAQLEGAVSEKVLATAEKQAALKQAERLASMLEAKEEQCRQLQGAVADLEAQLGALRLLDSELGHIAERSNQLHADNQAKQAQLAELVATAEAAACDRARLQATLESMRVEEAKLLAAVEEHTRQRAELSGSVEALKAAMEATQGQLLAAQAAARQAQEERDGLAQAVARLEVERLELGQRAQQLAAERQGLQDEVSALSQQVLQSNAGLGACQQTLAACMPGAVGGQASAQGKQPPQLLELLGCVRAALQEREAAIRALTQDNRQRAERVQALQAQVDQLSRQVLVGASADAQRVLQASPMPAASSSSGGGGGGGSFALSRGPSAGSQPPSPAASCPAQFSFSPARQSSPTAGGRLPTPSLYSPGSAAAPQVSSPLSSPASAAPPATQLSAPPSYFSSSFLAPAAAAAAAGSGPAFPGATRPAAASALPLRAAPAAGAAARPAPTTSSCSSGVGSPAGSNMSCRLIVSPAGTSPSRLSVASSTAAACPAAHQPPSPAGPSGGPATSSPSPTGSTAGSTALGGGQEQLRQLLLRQGCSAAAADAALQLPEVSQERLGFLLELVVQERVSAEDAQQVIRAAGDGDARPLLRVLDSVKRRIVAGTAGRRRQQQQQQQTEPGQQALPAPAPPAGSPAAALSPGSASELAAVRRQIQQLQSSIQQRQ